MSAVEKSSPKPPTPVLPRSSSRPFVERIERLEEEKKTISEDIRDVYAESKANGFDTKALRAVIRLRKRDRRSAASSR